VRNSGAGIKRPEWAVKKINFGSMHDTESSLSGLKLHTVCHQARCPNLSECYGRGTATFLILGDTCTRGCAFCNVKKGNPAGTDKDEAGRVAEAVKRLGLKYVVITSVTRDDLADGGASEFARVIKAVAETGHGTNIEVLVPDFMGNTNAIDNVLIEKPHVFAHNVETVPSLYHIRPGADYERSLQVLKYAKLKDPSILTKSAIMLGIGEKEEEVMKVLRDLINSGCDFVSIGQYMQPDRQHYPVMEYINPEQFIKYKTAALGLGFKHVESGVWVRSSYMADKYK
jgi:lipoic acid synthetase